MNFFEEFFKTFEKERGSFFKQAQDNYDDFKRFMNEYIKKPGSHCNFSDKEAFYFKNFLDFWSPKNMPWMNENVIKSAIQTSGMNFFKGFQNFMDDFMEGTVSLGNNSSFKIGENIAITPGKVILQTPMFELIAYENNKEVNKIPIVIFPSWVNKFYIFDLQQSNSFVKYLSDNGFAVFIVSWVNPQDEIDLCEYINSVDEVADFLIKTYEFEKLHGLGYCFGGNALLASASLKDNQKKWKSLSLLTTLVNFNLLGDLRFFTDNEAVEKIRKNHGKFINGKAMQMFFQSLRANDLIWSAMIKNYWIAQDQEGLDLLFWNADPCNVSTKTHIESLEKWCQRNELFEEKFKVGRSVSKISKIKVPVLSVGALKDHITPWKGCFDIIKKIPHAKLILSQSGHIAGVINPPGRKKYGYFKNLENYDIQSCLNFAEKHEGSWWPELLDFLRQQEAGLVKGKKHKGIRSAPGEYIF